MLGVFCNLPSPALVEMLGFQGFDFAIIDAEHGVQDLETCEHMVRAAEVSGTTSIVRIAVNLPQNILRYLDAGAMGVQIPMVNTRAEAEAVVQAVKYPPLGGRGLATIRASGYGIPMPLADYVKLANGEVLIVVQVETVQAVRNVQEIVAVEGIDVVFVGPTDLSASMGYVGQTGHPQVRSTIEQVGRMAVAAGKAAGTIARDAEDYEHWRQAGFQYLCTGVTTLIQAAGKSYLQSCRERETKPAGEALRRPS